MFDLHYDLLSFCYVCYLKDDYTFLEEWKKNYRIDNVRGVVANLYFMSIPEMKEELHPSYYRKDVSVLEMFRISTEIAKKFFPDTLFLFSIEGCDYIDIDDLEELYRLGLRNILPVWNNKNQYASGNRSDSGLTNRGKKLLDKAIQLGISIDLSHANTKSYNEIIDYIKSTKKKAYVMASHSNCRGLFDHPRNLSDEEILKLKEVDGILGVVSYRLFLDHSNTSSIREEYIKHITHAVSLLGSSHVCVSSDNMDFLVDEDPFYADMPVYNYQVIGRSLFDDLNKVFSIEECNNILYNNFKLRYDKLINKEEE